MNTKKLFFDWENNINHTGFKLSGKPLLFDETLRDALQATYVGFPSVQQKIKYLEKASEIGMDSINLGMPVSGEKQKKECIELAKHIRTNKLKIIPACIGRALVKDVEEIAAVAQKSGIKIVAHLLGGGSEVRNQIENWDLKTIGGRIKESVKLAIKNNLVVNFMTEDTTRARPETSEYLFKTGIENGAKYICISDTVGVATPLSAYNLTRFIKEKIVKDNQITIDWHGHNDRGFTLANALFSLYAGANRIHVTALGVGERAGNTAAEELIVNFFLLGMRQFDLEKIDKYIKTAEGVLQYKIPVNKPIAGNGVFKTATGIHVAAIKKALDLNDDKLANLVYSFIDPREIGKSMEVLVSPMSGKANIELIAKKYHRGVSRDKIIEILSFCKKENRVMSEKEVLFLIDNSQPL